MGERVGGAGDHQCRKSGVDGVAVEDVCTINCFIESCSGWPVCRCIVSLSY